MTIEHRTKEKCPFCGSTEIDYGNIVTGSAMSFGALTGMNTYYRSEKGRVQVMFYCGTCLNCGHIELFLDPKQIKLQKEHYNQKKK